MRTRRKVGIKYCGGCNPGYERVEMIQRVQFRINDQFLFLRHDEPDIEVMVLVNGCPRACANKNSNHPEVPSRSIVGESDFKSLIDWLVALDEKGDI